MKNKEVKKLSIDELKNKSALLKKDLFNLRFQKSNGQLTNPSKVKFIKRDISRMLAQIQRQDKR